MMALKVDKVTLAAAPWDLGPLTPAQIAGKTIEEATYQDPETGKRVNPNGVIRTRRETWVGRYHRQGKLTDAQANIAAELFEASAGMPARDPLAAIIRVDASAGDFDHEAARVDRRRKFFRMWAEVPTFARPVIQHVVLHDCSLRSMAGCIDGRTEARHLDRLQRGLEVLCEAWA